MSETKKKSLDRQKRLIAALAYYDEQRPKRSRARVIEEIRYRFRIGEKSMRWAMLQRVVMQAN